MTINQPTVDITKESATPLHGLGSRYIDPTNGNEYRYMCADGAVTANLLYTYDDSWNIEEPLTTTIAASGECHPLCVSPIAITDAYYAWVFVGPGQVTLTTATGLAVVAQAKIFTSSTAGCVDDDSSGEVLIPGLVAYTAVASATTGTFIATTQLYVSN